MKNVLKISVVGCGDHSNRFVYPVLSGLPGVELSAVCALERGQAERCRSRHGARKAYTDYREMLEQEQPDAVVVVGPPRLHYEAGLFCIERRIPFYTEKPLGENREQAEELARKADAAGVFGQVGFMMRHSAVFKEVARLSAGGESGDFVQGTVKYFTSGPYRADDTYGLAGHDDLSFLRRYLLVQAVHPVNLAASFLGEPVGIDASASFVGENVLVDIRLRDGDGRRANALLHTFVAPGYGNLRFETDLCFANRTMIVTRGFDELDHYPPEDSGEGNVRQWRFPAFGNAFVKMGYENELRHFFDGVRQGALPAGSTTLEDGAKTMRILETAFRQISASLGKE